MVVAKLKQTSLGLFLAVVSITMVAGSAAALVGDIGEQLSLLSMQYRVTTLSTHHAYLPGVFLGGLALLVAIAARIVQGKNPSAYRQLIRVSTLTMIAALIVAFVGAFFIKGYWSSRMESYGYTRCSERDLAIASRIDRSIWAKEQSFCQDPVVKRILRRANEEELVRRVRA